MRIAVLGTGSVGRSLASGLARIGHDVALGTRDPQATTARDDVAAWLAEHADIGVATFDAAAAGAELVVNATMGVSSLEAIQSVDASHLQGKILIDAANPLDFSQGFPPTLTVKDTDSLAEQIQRTVPDAKVVKTFNTVTADVMVDPSLVGDGDTTLFVAGNDDDAKAVVSGLLTDLGWRDVVDLGDLTAARGLEMWLPLWVRVMGATGTARFNLKIIR